MEIREYIRELYGNSSGYSIPAQERDEIIRHGGEPTYGEITLEGVSLLIAEFELTRHSVFYDLGSGLGKVPIQIMLEADVRKSIGIERSKTRNDLGVAVIERLRDEKMIPRGRTLKLIRGDILGYSYDDATHIYMASLCFSDEFMAKIAAHLSKGKPGLIVASLRPIPEGYGFTLMKTKSLPMTWSDDTPVYFYCLERKKR